MRRTDRSARTLEKDMRLKTRDAKRAFQDYVASAGKSLGTPARGLEAMFGFFRDERATDTVGIEEDGDMLLFEWGTHDWGDGRGRHFSLGCTRQLIPREGGGDDIYQLRLVYAFPPSPDLALLGGGNQWCDTPDNLKSFERSVKTSPPFLALAERTDAGLELSFGPT